MKKLYRTNYYDAWVAFRKSDDYKKAWDTLQKTGIKQRYANNILRIAFDAGWGNRKIKEQP